nr:GntR family transcriptional regulator [Clostridia bacterium]
MKEEITLDSAHRVYQYLKQRIDDGTFPSGSKLPSLRSLSEQYGINKMTAHTAISILVNEGALEVKKGKGTYVSDATKKREQPIGVLLTDFSKPTNVDLDILSNIQHNLGLQYYLLPICASENYDIFCDNLERLLNFGAAGLIVTPPIRSHENAEQLARAQHLLSQRPAVFINRLVEGVAGDLFTMDLYSGMLKAMEYFAMREKKRVAVVLHNTRKFADEQLAAWREGCQRFGMEADERLILPWNDDFTIVRDQLADLIPLYDALIGSDMVLYTMQDVLVKSRL